MDGDGYEETSNPGRGDVAVWRVVLKDSTVNNEPENKNIFQKLRDFIEKIKNPKLEVKHSARVHDNTYRMMVEGLGGMDTKTRIQPVIELTSYGNETYYRKNK